jgi:hypothetical protein
MCYPTGMTQKNMPFDRFFSPELRIGRSFEREIAIL